MPDFVLSLFDTGGFPPRWKCGVWEPAHGWLHILSDLGVWSAYLAIPCVLVYFAWRRKDMPFRRVFLLFGAFILACGSTHLMEAAIFWWPAYRLLGVLKLLTAVVSWATVVALAREVPKALALRSPEDLEREVAARKLAEASLEERVRKRTEDLSAANAALVGERERFRTTLASIGDAVIATDEAGRVTFLNPAAEAHTGWSEGSAVGRPLHQVFQVLNESTRRPVESPTTEALRGASVGPRNHTLLVGRDGAERPIDECASPIRDPAGGVVGAVLVFRDIGEQRQAEAAQSEQNRLTALRADVGGALAAATPVGPALKKCCEALVQHAGAAFARIWTLDPQAQVLELRASAGPCASANGAQAAVPLGAHKIGRIASSGRAYFSSALSDDTPVGDRDWAREEGVVAFAGYPLAVEGRVIGVMALFAKTPFSEGVLTGLTALADGLTQYVDRKRGEERLRESEERFRTMADCAPLLVWMTGPDGGCQYVNRRWVELVGRDSALLMGDGWAEELHPDDRAAAAANFRAAVRARRECRAEYRLRRADGAYRWVSSLGTPRFADSGQFLGYVGVTIDETDRREAERATAESNRLYRLLADTMEDVITLHAPDGRYEYVSPSFHRTYGPGAEGILGQGYVERMHPDDLPAVRAAHAANLRGERTRTEWRFRGFDDAYVWLETAAIPVSGGGRAEAGRGDAVTGIVCCTRDVTARKTLEAQAIQARKLEAIGYTTGGIAHDFNNLLTVINGCGELVLDALPPGHPERPLVADIVKAGERGAALTRQLLAFSRQQMLKVEAFDPNAAVRETAELLARVLGPGVRLRVELAPRVGAVLGDPGEFGRVVMNLAVNARDAMPGGGELLLATGTYELGPDDMPPSPDACPGRYVRLSVADSGHGMAADVLARLFEPFFTTKPVGQGTGLGLATVYGIVRQSRGFVLVESEVGKGSAFHVHFPRHDTVAEEEAVEEAAPAPPARVAGTESVLVVEDDALVRTLTVAILKRQGYEVFVAEDAAAALALCDGLPRPPDLLLTDVLMPGMGGQELAQALAARFPALKVVFLSGYTADVRLGHGLDPGRVWFFQKPYTSESLSRFVRGVLDGTAAG